MWHGYCSKPKDYQIPKDVVWCLFFSIRYSTTTGESMKAIIVYKIVVDLTSIMRSYDCLKNWKQNFLHLFSFLNHTVVVSVYCSARPTQCLLFAFICGDANLRKRILS